MDAIAEASTVKGVWSSSSKDHSLSVCLGTTGSTPGSGGGPTGHLQRSRAILLLTKAAAELSSCGWPTPHTQPLCKALECLQLLTCGFYSEKSIPGRGSEFRRTLKHIEILYNFIYNN